MFHNNASADCKSAPSTQCQQQDNHLIGKQLLNIKMRKIKVLLLFIFSAFYSCKLDKKEEKNLDKVKVESNVVIDYNNLVSSKMIDSLIDTGHLFIKKEFNLYDDSSEGAGVESYTDNKGFLVKIKATYFGHSGKSEWSYYFDNDNLFFVEEKEYRYTEPVSYNSNPDINSIMRGEYFLEKGNLIKWIDKNKLTIDSSSQRFKQIENHLKKMTKEFRQEIKATER